MGRPGVDPAQELVDDQDGEKRDEDLRHPIRRVVQDHRVGPEGDDKSPAGQARHLQERQEPAQGGQHRRSEHRGLKRDGHQRRRQRLDEGERHVDQGHQRRPDEPDRSELGRGVVEGRVGVQETERRVRRNHPHRHGQPVAENRIGDKAEHEERQGLGPRHTHAHPGGAGGAEDTGAPALTSRAWRAVECEPRGGMSSRFRGSLQSLRPAVGSDSLSWKGYALVLMFHQTDALLA